MSIFTPVKPETKFVENADDRFELVGSSTYEINKIREASGDPNKTVFTRSELRLVGIGIGFLCLDRILIPLQDTCPEKFGLLPQEFISQYLPNTKDAQQRFERLFKLIQCKNEAGELTRHCNADEELLSRFAFDHLQSEVVPACLPLFLEVGFDKTRNDNVQRAARLARRFIYELPAERYKGKGATPAIARVVEIVNERDESGAMLHHGQTASGLFKIVALNSPVVSDLRLPLLQALREYQNPANHSPETVTTALKAELEIFL